MTEVEAGERPIDGEQPGPSTRTRRIAVLAAVIAVGAVLAPVFRSPAPDSFPLSTYPMFARDRDDRTWIDTVIARTDDGQVVRLTPQLISGSDEPVLASATVTHAITGGTTASLCDRVVGRLAAGDDRGLATVEVVSERHDLDRFTPDEPIETTIHHECAVRP